MIVADVVWTESVKLDNKVLWLIKHLLVVIIVKRCIRLTNLTVQHILYVIYFCQQNHLGCLYWNIFYSAWLNMIGWHWLHNYLKRLYDIWFCVCFMPLFQVRSKLASLDGIVPSSHGFMVGSSGMKNVWLSMEHQTILWCNQLVVQVHKMILLFWPMGDTYLCNGDSFWRLYVLQLSHTLLNLVNPETGQPFPSVKKRLLVFVRMLQSGLPQNFKLLEHMQSSPVKDFPTKDEKDDTGTAYMSLLVDNLHFTILWVLLFVHKY